MTKDEGLIDQILHGFPAAEPLFNQQGVILHMEGSGYVVTTPEGDVWSTGVYSEESWLEQVGACVMVDRDAAETFDLWDTLIGDLQPEGTDWAAWAQQWTLDQIEEAVEIEL